LLQRDAVSGGRQQNDWQRELLAQLSYEFKRAARSLQTGGHEAEVWLRFQLANLLQYLVGGLNDHGYRVSHGPNLGGEAARHRLPIFCDNN